MRRLVCLIAAVALVALTGCESGNGFQTAGGRSKSILRAVEPICGASRDSGPRHGVVNIMLMEGATDDGIVTCGDGTNHYFDG